MKIRRSREKTQTGIETYIDMVKEIRVCGSKQGENPDRD